MEKQEFGQRKRVQLDLSEDSFKALKNLQAQLGAASVSATIRSAVKFCLYYLELQDKGGYISKQSPGEEIPQTVRFDFFCG